MSLLLALVVPARADCSNLVVLPGSRGEQLSLDAMQTSADVFGAAETLNREVLPNVPSASDGGGFAAYLGLQSYFNVVRVPAVSIGGMGGSDCRLEGDDLYRSYPFDVNTVNVAFGTRTGPVGLFYSTSALATTVAANRFQRGLITSANALGGLYWSFAGPFVGAATSSDAESDTVFTYDYMAGASLDAWVAQGAVGYVGSKGLYANLSSDKAYLFGSFVVSDAFQRVPLAASGASRIPIAGTFTSVYGRRLDIDARALGQAPALERASLYTAHLDEENLFGMIDVKGAMAVKPDLVLQDAMLRWHQPVDAEVLKASGMSTDDLTGAWVGVVRALDQPQYDVEGGYRLQAGVRFGKPESSEGMSTSPVLSLSINDDAVMDLFPYAKNTVYLRISGVTRQGFDL